MMRPLTLEDITTKDPERWCENVALYRQACSGNPPNLRHLREGSAYAFPNKDKGGFNYADFPQDGWENGSREVNLDKFKKYPWLYLKPEILEHLLIQIDRQNDGGYKGRLEGYPDSIASWFTFKDAQPLCLDKIGEVNYFTLATLYSKIQPTLILNNHLNNDKDQLQRKEVTLLRGEGLPGAVIHGRQHKATVTVGHLSYQVCPE